MAQLFGFGLSSGQRRPLSAALRPAPGLGERETAWLAEPARAAAIRTLEEDGFHEYVEAEVSTVELAREAMARSLAAGAINPAEVDAVMLITESFWDTDIARQKAKGSYEAFRMRNEFLESLSDLGLVNAYPYANWLSACANLGPSLQLARTLVDSGQHRRLLMVVADRLPPAIPRPMHNSSAVLSDLAASCLIGEEPQGFAIERIVSVAAPRIASYNFDDKNDLAKLVAETLRSMQKLDREFTKAVGHRIRDCEQVIAGHFHPMSLKVITAGLGVPESRIHREARAEYAHANACDNLLTLAKLSAENYFAAGQQVLLLNTGVWAWSAVVLRKT